jgi:hypothetical protein
LANSFSQANHYNAANFSFSLRSIMTRRFIILTLLWGTLVLTSCGPDVETVQMTVNSQVAAAVNSTIAAMPTSIANSTNTPYPTYTPLATLTPYATYTPQATFTPQPTFTPPPTLTPMPTDTVEPAATATATQAAASAAVPAVPSQPTAQPATDAQVQVLAAIDNFLHDVDVYVASITAQFTGGSAFGWTANRIVKCQDLVNAYNHGLITVTIDVIQSPANVQNAYNTYLAAKPLFQEAAHTWAEVCQAALANGEEKEIGSQDVGVISGKMDQIKNMLNGVANELRTQ